MMRLEVGRAVPLAPTDVELVADVLRGHIGAFAHIVDRYQSMLFRYARGMGLDGDTAADMVQDSLVRAYASLRECRDPAHLRSWLFRILRNACLDYFKSVRRRSISLEDAPTGEPAAVGASDPELRHVLDDALGRLSPLLREAFLLKHEAGYTYDEIAELTDSTPSAAKMRVHRARDDLRALLDIASSMAM